MQKRMIGVICGAAVVLLLVGGIVLLTRPTGEDSSSETTEAITQSPEEQAALTLSDASADDVKRISITNETGSYQVVPTKNISGNKEDSTDTTETDITFGIEGWEDLPTNTALIGTLANNTASLQAEQCVEEHTEDLEKFGLGKDATQVEMQFNDGSTFSFRIGDSVVGGSTLHWQTAILSIR